MGFLGMNVFPVMSSNFRLLEMEMRHQTHTQEADVGESAHSHPEMKLRAPLGGISEGQGRAGKVQKAETSAGGNLALSRTDLGRPSPARSPRTRSRKRRGVVVPIPQSHRSVSQSTSIFLSIYITRYRQKKKKGSGKENFT